MSPRALALQQMATKPLSRYPESYVQQIRPCPKMDSARSQRRRRFRYKLDGDCSGFRVPPSYQMVRVHKTQYLRRASMTDIPRAPSYFSTYFEEQVRQEESGGGPLKTLFIDRDPDTFTDICRHLQGTSLPSRT